MGCIHAGKKFTTSQPIRRRFIATGFLPVYGYFNIGAGASITEVGYFNTTRIQISLSLTMNFSLILFYDLKDDDTFARLEIHLNV